MASFFIPLKDLFAAEGLPAEILSSGLTSIVDQIGINQYNVESLEDVLFFQADLGFRVGETQDTRFQLSLPAFPELAILIDASARLEIWFQEDFKLRLGVGALALRLPSQFLKPSRIGTDGSWEWDPAREFVEATLDFNPIRDELSSHSRDFPCYLNFDVNGGLTLDLPVATDGVTHVNPVTTLNGPAMIGDSGFVVNIEELSLDLNSDNPLIRFNKATLIPPTDLAASPLLPIISIEDAVLSSRGFSGRVNADWPLTYDDQNHRFQYKINQNGSEQTYDAKIFEIWGGLRHIGISFDQNLPIGVDITGGLLIPYFNEPADTRINIESNGKFTLTIASADEEGITLSKEELLALNVKSLSLSKDANNVGSVVITGGLEPLLMATDGLQWPRLDVTDLYIDTTGKFKIKEAWLDLKELATLDLWGFHFELRRIGIGYEDVGDKLWVDLSGGLRLIEQIPVALDVEGFRIKWPRTLLDDVTGPLTLDDIQAAASQLEVSFEGIYLFFGVPDAVEFEGLIRFFKDAQVVGFAGDMALRVPASGFGLEAGLLIGLSFAPPFPFLYVYFGVDLPSGIPLGQSGLALKGAQGMFGLNVGPDKTPEQNWYYDWYKRGPIVGAHPTNKWKPLHNALALGVGVTITTTDGYVKGVRGLIVLAIPGPILIIEGRALILSGLQPNAEPPLRALAVFDGGAGTVQFNVEAEATLIADLLKAYGMLEAFFDFNDLTNWHLYLGQDTPRDRRIRAEILKLDNAFLFKADAYLMIDMIGAETLRSRIGVSIGFEPKVPNVDPLEVDFAATISGDGLVTARPEQFSGDINLSAYIRLSALGVSLRLSADAGVLTEGPKPFKVGAHVRVAAEMPTPLDPVETTLEFEWEAPTTPRVESPLSEIVVNSRFDLTGAGFRADATEPLNLIHDFETIDGNWENPARISPIVPVDSKPIIGFKQKMNSEITSFARHPDGRHHHYDVGLFYFYPSVVSIKLYEHKKLEHDLWYGDVRDWTLIASTTRQDNKLLPGVWLTESEPESPETPSPRRIQFWTDNPLSSSAQALGPGYKLFRGAIKPGKHLAQRLLDDYPELLQCNYTKATSTCVDFDAVGNLVIDRGKSWEYEDLLFESTFGKVAIQTVGPRTFSVGSSRSFFATISNLVLRTASWLSNTLLNRRSEHRCLLIDGYIDIRFRRRVRKVRIILCKPPKLSEREIATRISVRRGSRSASELNGSRNNPRKNVTLSDIRACNVSLPADFNFSEEEWLIEADEGFDCLHIIRMGEFAIREICYTTETEVARSRLAMDECRNNGNLPTEGQTLIPGAYYRLDVETEVDGDLVWDDVPFDLESPIGQMLEIAYNELVDRLGQFPRIYHQTCFFQTEAPPANLRSYIKWTNPQHQSERFFYGDDIAVRFLRSNLESMFQPPFTLKAQIRNTSGDIVDGTITTWARAKSATLFPEESVWETHRRTLYWPERLPPQDNLLLARFTASEGLLPGSRYQLELICASGPDGEDKVLYQSSFVTSQFRGFVELVQSCAGPQSVPVKAGYTSNYSAINELRSSSIHLARSRRSWERAEVDFRFETLEGGREGLEQARIKRREACAAHDAKFLVLAESLADLYFRPVASDVELYLVRTSDGEAIVCAWLRSPETLDINMPVFDESDGIIIDSVGRTEIKLLRNATEAPIIILPNADSSQILIFPRPGRPWRRGEFTFQLTYHRDFGDETRPIDHRYDRPVEYLLGSAEVQSFALKWSW